MYQNKPLWIFILSYLTLVEGDYIKLHAHLRNRNCYRITSFHVNLVGGTIFWKSTCTLTIQHRAFGHGRFPMWKSAWLAVVFKRWGTAAAGTTTVNIYLCVIFQGFTEALLRRSDIEPHKLILGKLPKTYWTSQRRKERERYRQKETKFQSLGTGQLKALTPTIHLNTGTTQTNWKLSLKELWVVRIKRQIGVI